MRHVISLAACLWIGLQVLGAAPVLAAPGLCVGPVCGDAFTRSAKHVFQLRMRLSDQSGHHERITVDCRDGRISPRSARWSGAMAPPWPAGPAG